MFAKIEVSIILFFYKFLSENMKNSLLIGIGIKITFNHS